MARTAQPRAPRLPAGTSPAGEPLRSFLERVWFGPPPGPLLSALLLPLSALSFLYGALVRWRRRRYARPGRARRAPAKVLSVGNLTVGGAGKTPLTIALAQRMMEAGMRPVVLSRGYGREGRAPLLVSDGGPPRASAREAGDEPLLIARSCPGVPVWVGADRAELAERAARAFPGCTLVLDDGLQHLRLHRDADLVAVDAARPFGNGRLLPRGPLREGLEVLAAAALVVLTKVDQAAPDQVEALAARLRALTGREPARAAYVPWDVTDLEGRSLGLGALEGRRVFALAGVARPGSFRATLASLGAQLVGAAWYPDHHPFRREELDHVLAWARREGAEAIALTEKDAVRLPPGTPGPLRVVRVRARLVAGGEALDALVRELR